MIVDGGAHDVSEHLPPTDEPPVVEDLNLLVQRAREGDETVLPQLREMLDTRAELWKYFGNIAAHAKETWLRVISGVDLALKECTARKAEDLVRELAGPAPTAIERLLAERAALCWMQIHHADALLAWMFHTRFFGSGGGRCICASSQFRERPSGFRLGGRAQVHRAG